MNGDAHPTVKVWDAFVRIAHWSLVIAVTAAWLTRHSDSPWHEWLGYAALTIILLRLIWGFAGSPYTRFTDFVRRPSATLGYTKAVISHREPRYLGHNPLGGWMIVALITAVALLGLTGWLGTTDTYWGSRGSPRRMKPSPMYSSSSSSCTSRGWCSHRFGIAKIS